MLSWVKRIAGAEERSQQQEEKLPELSEWNRKCDDCETENGQLHDLFCTRERCPFCKGQLASCDCLPEVLKLNEEERRAVDEYVDDEVEPLKSIMARWKSALDKKGRVPFRTTPLTVDADGLILTAARGELGFLRRLLSEGVSVDAANEVNHSALMTAARCSQISIVRFLLETGADVRHRNQHGHTPLHCAVQSPASHFNEEAQQACVQALVERGAELEAKDQSGGTPLMNAAWFGCLRPVRYLLDKGASPKVADGKGRTAESLARERGHVEVAEILAQRTR
jgi:hypothetical protein